MTRHWRTCLEIVYFSHDGEVGPPKYITCASTAHLDLLLVPSPCFPLVGGTLEPASFARQIHLELATVPVAARDPSSRQVALTGVVSMWPEAPDEF
jgi:hypothetical protein